MSDQTGSFVDSAINSGTSNAIAIRNGLITTFGKVRLRKPVLYNSGPQTLAGDTDFILGDTTNGSFTVSLPANPTDGDVYVFYKAVAANTLTIGRNGKNIDFAASDLTITAIKGLARLLWSSGANSWISW